METLRSYAFWFCLGAVAVLLVVTYAVVVAPESSIAKENKNKLEERQNNLNTFLAKKDSLKNRKWIAAAASRKADLSKEKKLCSDQFETMQIVAPLKDTYIDERTGRILKKVEYRDKYEKEAAAIRAKLQKAMIIEDKAFDFREFGTGLPNDDEGTFLAKELVIQRHLADTLLESKAKKLLLIRFGSPTSAPGISKAHPVTNVLNIYEEYRLWLELDIAYKDLETLVEKILANKCRFLIQQFSLEATGFDPQTSPQDRTGTVPRRTGMPGPEDRFFGGLPPPDMNIAGPEGAAPALRYESGDDPAKQGEKLVRVRMELRTCDFIVPAEASSPAAKK